MATKRKSTKSSGFINIGIKQYKKPAYVVAELRHDSRIAYSPKGFTGSADVEAATRKLNTVLEKFNV